MSTEQDDRSSHLEQQAMAETPLQDERATASALPTITMAEGRTHLDLSPDAAVIIDALGSIVLVNEQAATLFGYSPHELNGQQLEVLLPGRFHTAHAAHRRTYVTTPLRRPMGGASTWWDDAKMAASFRWISVYVPSSWTRRST